MTSSRPAGQALRELLALPMGSREERKAILKAVADYLHLELQIETGSELALPVETVIRIARIVARCSEPDPSPSRHELEVREHAPYWRLYLNGEYIDGYEREDVAEHIAERARRALAVKE